MNFQNVVPLYRQRETVTSDMLASNSRQGAQWLETTPKATPDNAESRSGLCRKPLRTMPNAAPDNVESNSPRHETLINH